MNYIHRYQNKDETSHLTWNIACLSIFFSIERQVIFHHVQEVRLPSLVLSCFQKTSAASGARLILYQLCCLKKKKKGQKWDLLISKTNFRVKQEGCDAGVVLRPPIVAEKNFFFYIISPQCLCFVCISLHKIPTWPQNGLLPHGYAGIFYLLASTF